MCAYERRRAIGRPGIWWLAALAVAVAASIAQAARQSPTSTARLGGVVVDTDSGAPLPDVHIDVRAASGGAIARATTDASGRYLVTGLAAGTYVVTASKPAYAAATFGRLHAMDTGGTIALTDGQNRTLVDFQLSREATLAGRVQRTNGEPYPDAVVRVLRPHLLDDRRQLVTFGTARTDQNGEYRISGLVAGDYYVSVSLFERDDSRAAVYAPTFYPGSSEVATATRVRLSSGALVRLDPMTPLPLAWQRLTGRLKAFNGKPLIRGALIMQPNDPDRLSFSPDAITTVFADGRFTIDFVVPGSYIVRVHGGTGPRDEDLSAAWAVRVEQERVPEATLTLEPGSELSGTVEFEPRGARPPEDMTSIRVFEPLVDGTNFGAGSEARVEAGGHFHLVGVDAGCRLLRVRGLPFPWSLERVMQGGRDITDTPLDIIQRQKLEDMRVVLTNVATGFTGEVHNRASAPVANYLVVAFPVERSYWRPLSRYVLSTRTDWEGRYRLASLPPGQYHLAAVNDFEEADIYDRDTLDQIVSRSVVIDLRRAEMRVQDLTVTLGQRSGG